MTSFWRGITSFLCWLLQDMLHQRMAKKMKDTHWHLAEGISSITGLIGENYLQQNHDRLTADAQ